MTKITNVMEQLEKGIPEELIPTMHSILSRQAVGEKIILKERIVKSGTYLQVYKYDKYSWKYILEEKVKVR